MAEKKQLRAIYGKLGRTAIASLLAFPLFTLVWLSAVQQWVYPQLWDSHFTLENWILMASNSQGIMQSLGLSLAFSSTLAVAIAALGLATSGIIEAHPKRAMLRSLSYYPYLIAPVVMGTMLRYYFLKWGLVGSWAGVALAQFLFIFPYSIIFFSGFWTAKTRDMHNQARTLGATAFQTFTRITLPAAKKWLGLGIFQCFLISWFEYGITQVIGLGRVPTLTIKVIQLVREANPYLAAVASLLMLLPPMMLLLINKQALKAGH